MTKNEQHQHEHGILQEMKLKLYSKLSVVNNLSEIYGYYSKETQDKIDELTESVIDYNVYSRYVYAGQGFYSYCELIDRNQKTLKLVFEFSFQ